jgi:fucose permease
VRRPSVILPLAFFAFGLMWGTWWSMVPELVLHYQLSPGPLGAILTAGFVAALPAMVLAGRLLDRLGAARAIALPAVLMAAALLLAASLAPLPALVLAIGVLAVGSGTFDVAINGTAIADDSWSRAGRLTLLHAAFSAGGAAGAIGGGAVAASGLPFEVGYVAIALVLLALAVVVGRSHWRAGGPQPAVPPSLALALLPFAVIALLGLLAAGTLEAWSALYLREELGAGAFIGALGPTAYYVAATIGRLLGAAVASLLGAASTLLLAGAAAVAGMSIGLLVALPAAAIAGVAIAALGASFMLPVAVSLAAARAGAHPGRAASYVLTLGYVGFMVGPSVVGTVAELAGLRVALGIVPLVGVMVVLASRLPAVREAGARRNSARTT